MGRGQDERRRSHRALGVTRRPLARTLADALVFLIALALVLFALRLGGIFDPLLGGPRIIDGDSLRLDDRARSEVRLNGIDAPEYRQTCFDENGREWACGKEAARFLRGLVSGEVKCQPVDRDRYGRLVADCRAKDVSLNDEMLRGGYAVAYRAASAQRLGLEARARQAKRGIWRGRFERPEAWRARHRRMEGSLAGVDESD
jgi:endonuclease YncB( thermonuclease family)